MYCTFCGEEVLQDDAEYCRVCGRQLASGEGDSSRSDSETVSDSPRVNESGAGRSSASQYPTARRALPGFGVRFGAYLIDGGVALVIYLLVIVGVIGSERLVGMLYLHQVPNLADRWHMAAITYDSLWADKSAPGRPSRAAAMVEFSRGVPITQAALDDFQRQEDARRPVTEISLGEGSAISVGDRLTGLGGPTHTVLEIANGVAKIREDSQYPESITQRYDQNVEIFIIVPLALFAAFYYRWHSDSTGASLGKRALGLRVVRLAGGPPGDGAGMRRTLGAGLSGIAFGLGYLWAIGDPMNQTWHDKLADTYVVFQAED